MPAGGVDSAQRGRKKKSRRIREASPAERVAGYVVLVVLCAIALFVYLRQFEFNPAVEVALKERPITGKMQSGGGQAKSGLSALLSNDLPMLAPAAPVETFGPEDLSDKIDGKAELYLASGFKSMACRSYTLQSKEVAHVEIYLYEMDSPKGAFAVFSGQRRSGGEPSPLAKDAYFTENALFFATANIYVEIVADRASVKDALGEVGATLLSGLPKEENEAGEASLFPKRGLIAETVRLTASDAFGLEGLNDIFTAEYHLDSGEASAFLSARAADEEARTLAERYVKFLEENGYRPIQAEGAPSGAHVLGLEGYFEVVMTRGRILAGVHEASSLDVALDLGRDLASGLEGR